jgi:hypothetical protein
MLGNGVAALNPPMQGVPTSSRAADGRGMRSRSVVPTLLTLAAGAAVAVVARRLARRRAAAPAVSAAAAPVVAETVVAPSTEGRAVILPFTRPAAPAPAPQATPARCGENGGRTKAGAPCAARATSGGRCHHHRLAA